MTLFGGPRQRLLIVCSAVFAVCLCSIPLVVAEHGRNFAGEFQVRDVVDEGQVVKFDLHVKVFNFSGASVKHATLAVADRRPGNGSDAIEYQGSFTNVSIPYRKWITIDGSFMVPIREYHEWQRGAVPDLVVTYTDESGKEIQNSVELRPAIGGGLPIGEAR